MDVQTLCVILGTSNNVIKQKTEGLTVAVALPRQLQTGSWAIFWSTANRPWA